MLFLLMNFVEIGQSSCTIFIFQDAGYQTDIFRLFEFVVGLCCNFPDPMVNFIARSDCKLNKTVFVLVPRIC